MLGGIGSWMRTRNRGWMGVEHKERQSRNERLRKTDPVLSLLAARADVAVSQSRLEASPVSAFETPCLPCLQARCGLDKVRRFQQDTPSFVTGYFRLSDQLYR